MLKLITKVKLRSRIVLRCDKHPRYNPEKDGQGGIMGNCAGCRVAYDLYALRQRLVSTLKQYEYETKGIELVKPKAKKEVTSEATA